MPNATVFLEDVFTLLWQLRATEARLPQGRFLSPSSVAQTNALLSQPITPAPRRERDHLRLSLMHALCLHMGLIAPMQGMLRPTLRTLRWLSEPPVQQWQLLVNTLFKPSEDMDALWRDFQLPGSHWIHPRESLLRCVAQLRERAAGSRPWVSLRAIAAKLPIPLDDDPKAQPPAVARQLALLLEALGLVERRNAALRWLDAPLLSNTPAPATPCFFNGAEVLVTPAGAAWPALIALADFASMETAWPQRRIRFSQERLHHTLQRGHALPALFAALETLLGQPVPDDFFQLVQGWSHHFGRVRIRQAVLLESRDETLLQSLLEQRSIRQCAKPISSKAAVVRPDKIHALVRRLQRKGVSPRVLLPVAPAPAGHFEAPAQAQLYLAAQTCHALAGALPDACVPPLSLIQSLESQLAPADIAMAKAMAEAGAAHVLQTNVRDDDAPAVSPEDVLNATARAISERAPLHIMYRGRDDVESVARLVEPMRMEWQHGIAYLIAWCHLAGGQRTFRLDRITSFSQSQSSHTPALASPARGQLPESS
jgi:hypothetical protein